MGIIKSILKNAVSKLKDFYKEYKKVTDKEKTKQLVEKFETPKISKEKAQEYKNTYKQIQRNLQEYYNPSKLRPASYQSKNELLIGILEDMGLNEEFRNNPQAKIDLAQMANSELVRIAEESPEFKSCFEKQFADLTEQDARAFKEKLQISGIFKIDDHGNLEYIKESGDKKHKFSEEGKGYHLDYIKANFKMRGQEYIREIVAKQCKMIYHEEEQENLGKKIFNKATREKYNSKGILMRQEEHIATVQQETFSDEETAKSLVNGENESVESIERLDSATSKILNREDVNGVYFIYKDKSYNYSKKVHTLNSAEDIADLEVLDELEKAIILGDSEIIEEHDEWFAQLTDEYKKDMLKEDIKNSSKKTGLNRMAEDEGLLQPNEISH